MGQPQLFLWEEKKKKVRKKSNIRFCFLHINLLFTQNCLLFVEKKPQNFRTFEISSHCPKIVNVYTVIKRKCWYYHKFQWETLKDWGCKTTCKKTNCSVCHECAATTDYFLVGFCRALWGFALVALNSFRRSEEKCCPHERSFKSLLFPEPQSPCGCWTCGDCREKIPNTKFAAP